ncbi:MAG: NifU N-terminal domain-containing protein [Acidimicrobiia bacterium]|nr:NifU N-terminal domain-containing protein [Acidimicrobiia bacterium]
MPVAMERTPNPAAMKFTVGTPLGGPATYTEASAADTPFDEVLSIRGVASVFATADFVTVTKTPEIDWDDITEPIVRILTAAFG